MTRRVLVLLSLVLALAGCGDSLTPANVAREPGGTLAVSFTRTFLPGFWEPGEHAYRLVITCPAQHVGPPVAGFTVSDQAPELGTVYLRIDGPGSRLLAPSDLGAVHPDDTTVAVITLAGLTENAAEDVRSDCSASIVYDGL
ncbi:MAG TPA: hypothetical protein VLB67_13065, partial [Acidimicrobiia bacterium]|nr:hypothetical protein [Acidimicrobiia bacterium]